MKYSHITIAGKICTGKSTLRRALEKNLGWQGLSTGELFRDYVKQHNLDLEKVEEQDKIGKEVDTMIQEKLRTQQHLIIDTWINGILSAQNETVYKVLIICNDDTRVQRFVEREHVTREEAEQRVFTRENSLLQKLSEMYQIDDILDPNHYNIVVDSSDKTAEEMANIIIQDMQV